MQTNFESRCGLPLELKLKEHPGKKFRPPLVEATEVRGRELIPLNPNQLLKPSVTRNELLLPVPNLRLFRENEPETKLQTKFPLPVAPKRSSTWLETPVKPSQETNLKENTLQTKPKLKAQEKQEALYPKKDTEAMIHKAEREEFLKNLERFLSFFSLGNLFRLFGRFANQEKTILPSPELVNAAEQGLAGEELSAGEVSLENQKQGLAQKIEEASGESFPAKFMESTASRFNLTKENLQDYERIFARTNAKMKEQYMMWLLLRLLKANANRLANKALVPYARGLRVRKYHQPEETIRQTELTLPVYFKALAYRCQLLLKQPEETLSLDKPAGQTKLALLEKSLRREAPTIKRILSKIVAENSDQSQAVPQERRYKHHPPSKENFQRKQLHAIAEEKRRHRIKKVKD